MLDCQNVLPEVVWQAAGVKIHFYGVLAAAGVLLAWWFIGKVAKHSPGKFPGKAAESSKQISDLVFHVCVAGFLGARIFFVLFYFFPFFWEHPAEILAVHHGGLSVHGGLAGGALGLWIFIRKSQWDFWRTADLLVPFLALALALGRIGNFANGELTGRATDWAFACNFGDGVGRWPVQIFDSLKNLIIFATTLFIFLKMNLRPGVVSAVFLVMIGAMRFLTEFWREPDRQLGFVFAFFTMGQIFAVLTFACGLWLLWRIFRK